MAVTHSLLRSRVTRSSLRFESSSAVTEEVFECIFMEKGTLRRRGASEEFGDAAMCILKRFLVLRHQIMREVQSYLGNYLFFVWGKMIFTFFYII